MSENFKIECGIFFAVLLFISAIVVGTIIDLGNKQTFDATITSTQIDDGNIYFILEKSDGTSMVYENEDSLWYGKFNSSDYIMNLKVGQTYTFTTVGYRIPFLSAYPNIVRYIPKSTP